jgi:CRISPR-associated endonuclease Cas3-HD
MKPFFLPDWLNRDEGDIWAKRKAEKSDLAPGESLAEHTWLVPARLVELMHQRPGLPAYLEAPHLWHCLFWACFLHDFGKAAGGFQAMLRQPEQRWKRRYEVLSLAFLDWIAPAFSSTEQQWMLAAVASHHKGAQDILEYCQHADVVESMVVELNEPVVRELWRWLSECSEAWIKELHLAPFGVQAIVPVAEEEAVHLVCRTGQARIAHWLETPANCLSEWKRPRYALLALVLVMLRGLTTTADHAASAHLAQIPPGIQESWRFLEERARAAFVERQRRTGKEGAVAMQIYQHQQACALHAHTSSRADQAPARMVWRTLSAHVRDISHALAKPDARHSRCSAACSSRPDAFPGISSSPARPAGRRTFRAGPGAYCCRRSAGQISAGVL